ncbi:MAG: helix-turn-helix domain-containing protein, partial [Burkholderiaceae bacterium]
NEYFSDGLTETLLHMLAPEPTPAVAATDETAPPNPTSAPAPAPPPEGEAVNPLEALLGLAQGEPLATLPAGGLPLRETLADIEKSYITQALAQTQGNVSRTARLLCIQRTTLIEKINKYELRASD